MARGELDISHATFEAMPITAPCATYATCSPASECWRPTTPAWNASLPGCAASSRQCRNSMPISSTDSPAGSCCVDCGCSADRDKITRSSEQGARAVILSTVRFLAWLDDHDTTITATTQADLDRYLVRYPGRAPMVAVFLDWTTGTGITADLHLPDRAAGRCPK